jgi:hypothetical protein
MLHSEPIVHRAMCSDLMEDIHLRDPGYWLLIENGLRFYLWRRAVLKQLGKTLDDRIFPNIPSFGFSFPFNMIGREDLSDPKCLATYGYCYDSWYKTIFNQDVIAFNQFLNITFWPNPRVPGDPMPVGLRSTFDHASTMWLESRNLKEAMALLNAAAETGFWFEEIPFAHWNPESKVTRKYLTTHVWKPAIDNDPGALERQKSLNLTMLQQQIAPSNQANIPLLPLVTVSDSTIIQRRSAALSKHKVKKSRVEEMENWEELFDFAAACGDIDTSPLILNNQKHADSLDAMVIDQSARLTVAPPLTYQDNGVEFEDIIDKNED